MNQNQMDRTEPMGCRSCQRTFWNRGQGDMKRPGWGNEPYPMRPGMQQGMYPPPAGMRQGMYPPQTGMYPGMYPPPADMQQGPVPYHAAYPYPMFMQGEDDDERDLERLQSMFPKSAKVIQPLVEDECDRMEYDGSLMFDEYPDKLTVEKLIENIYQRVQGGEEEMQEQMDPEEDVFATQCRNCNGNRFGDGIQDLITVMLFEEMHRRRCRRRRCKRWW